MTNELTKTADAEYIRKCEVCRRIADDVLADVVDKGTV